MEVRDVRLISGAGHVHSVVGCCASVVEGVKEEVRGDRAVRRATSGTGNWGTCRERAPGIESSLSRTLFPVPPSLQFIFPKVDWFSGFSLMFFFFPLIFFLSHPFSSLLVPGFILLSAWFFRFFWVCWNWFCSGCLAVVVRYRCFGTRSSCV